MGRAIGLEIKKCLVWKQQNEQPESSPQSKTGPQETDKVRKEKGANTTSKKEEESEEMEGVNQDSMMTADTEAGGSGSSSKA